VRHPLVALVVLVEYTLRVRARDGGAAARGGRSKSTRDGSKDPLAQVCQRVRVHSLHTRSIYFIRM
jgi:hypothetical protein